MVRAWTSSCTQTKLWLMVPLFRLVSSLVSHVIKFRISFFLMWRHFHLEQMWLETDEWSWAQLSLAILPSLLKRLSDTSPQRTTKKQSALWCYRGRKSLSLITTILTNRLYRTSRLDLQDQRKSMLRSRLMQMVSSRLKSGMLERVIPKTSQSLQTRWIFHRMRLTDWLRLLSLIEVGQIDAEICKNRKHWL